MGADIVVALPMTASAALLTPLPATTTMVRSVTRRVTRKTVFIGTSSLELTWLWGEPGAVGLAAAPDAHGPPGGGMLLRSPDEGKRLALGCSVSGLYPVQHPPQLPRDRDDDVFAAVLLGQHVPRVRFHFEVLRRRAPAEEREQLAQVV